MTEKLRDAPSLLQQVRAHAKARDSIAWSGQARQLLLWAADTIEAANAALSETAAKWNEATIFEAVARGWCSPANSRKEFDATLGEAIAKEVIAALKNAAPQVALSSESTATNAQETGQSGTPAESGSEPPNSAEVEALYLAAHEATTFLADMQAAPTTNYVRVLTKLDKALKPFDRRSERERK